MADKLHCDLEGKKNQYYFKVQIQFGLRTFSTISNDIKRRKYAIQEDCASSNQVALVIFGNLEEKWGNLKEQEGGGGEISEEMKKFTEGPCVKQYLKKCENLLKVLVVGIIVISNFFGRIKRKQKPHPPKTVLFKRL